MIDYWPWGVIITGTVTVTIWMNGHHWRAGWLVGAAAQLAQIGFGVVTGIWTFYFAAAPLVMFLWNWVQHPKREAARKRAAGAVLVDVTGSDQMIVMSRGVLDQIKQYTPRVSSPPSGIPLTMRYAMGAPWLASPIKPVNLSPFTAFTPANRSAGDELNDAYAELVDDIRQAGPLITPEQVGQGVGEVDVRPAAEQLGVDVPQDGDDRD